MFDPIKTDLTNASLGAPPNWDPAVDGECVALPVQIDPGQGCFHSWWRPSQDDLERLLNGGAVRLTVFGGSHPPVALNADAIDATPGVGETLPNSPV
jgi:hypothetical protein